jgi:hypothetical protein
VRARNLKPSLFKNELLATSDPLYAWIFEGLWCLSDREGRLEDRPRRIHLEINAGRAYEGTEASLNWLAENGFILRYEHGGARYIQVLQFKKHQNPHVREPASVIPAPGEHSASTVPAPDEHESGPALSSFPLPESPSPDAQRPERAPERANGRTRGSRVPEPFPISADMRTWAAEKCPHVTNVDGATEEFVDYWRGVPGRAGVKLDWVGTWRNRLRELEARAGRGNGRQKASNEWT